ARRVRRAPRRPVVELRLDLRVVVGAAPDEAADVDVEGEMARDAELETGAELAAEVFVVLRGVERIAPVVADVCARPAEAGEEIELRLRLRVDEEERVQRERRLTAAKAVVVAATHEIDVRLHAEVRRGLVAKAETGAAHARVVVRLAAEHGPFEVQVEA